jgi:hypothetical protein
MVEYDQQMLIADTVMFVFPTELFVRPQMLVQICSHHQSIVDKLSVFLK